MVYAICTACQNEASVKEATDVASLEAMSVETEVAPPKYESAPWWESWENGHFGGETFIVKNAELKSRIITLIGNSRYGEIGPHRWSTVYPVVVNKEKGILCISGESGFTKSDRMAIIIDVANNEVHVYVSKIRNLATDLYRATGFKNLERSNTKIFKDNVYQEE